MSNNNFEQSTELPEDPSKQPESREDLKKEIDMSNREVYKELAETGRKLEEHLNSETDEKEKGKIRSVLATTNTLAEQIRHYETGKSFNFEEFVATMEKASDILEEEAEPVEIGPVSPGDSYDLSAEGEVLSDKEREEKLDEEYEQLTEDEENGGGIGSAADSILGESSKVDITKHLTPEELEDVKRFARGENPAEELLDTPAKSQEKTSKDQRRFEEISEIILSDEIDKKAPRLYRALWEKRDKITANPENLSFIFEVTKNDTGKTAYMEVPAKMLHKKRSRNIDHFAEKVLSNAKQIETEEEPLNLAKMGKSQGINLES